MNAGGGVQERAPSTHDEGGTPRPAGVGDVTVDTGTERLSARVLIAGEHRSIGSLDDIADCHTDPEARIWVDVEDASEATLTQLADIFALHHLVAEDIIERNQRAKIVLWDDSLHLVVFAMAPDPEIAVAEIDVVLGRRFLITSHPAEWQPLAAVAAGGREVGDLLSMGTDMLLYGLIDPIIDGYFPVIDRISDQIDELEDDVVGGTDRTVVDRLFHARRSLLLIRHVVGPEREILNQLSNRELALIAEPHRPYFRDVYDHTLRVIDELDTHRELASGVLDAYLSSVNNSLSEVMKRLTAITAVLAGVGAAAGVFGMSEASTAFDLPAPLGFWIVVAVVVAIGVIVFVYFRRIDWI
jgi:magnesium transporter